jgi:hypothetical protein
LEEAVNWLCANPTHPDFQRDQNQPNVGEDDDLALALALSMEPMALLNDTKEESSEKKVEEDEDEKMEESEKEEIYDWRKIAKWLQDFDFLFSLLLRDKANGYLSRVVAKIFVTLFTARHQQKSSSWKGEDAEFGVDEKAVIDFVQNSFVNASTECSKSGEAGCSVYCSCAGVNALRYAVSSVFTHLINGRRGTLTQISFANEFPKVLIQLLMTFLDEASQGWRVRWVDTNTTDIQFEKPIEEIEEKEKDKENLRMVTSGSSHFNVTSFPPWLHPIAHSLVLLLRSPQALLHTTPVSPTQTPIEAEIFNYLATKIGPNISLPHKTMLLSVAMEYLSFPHLPSSVRTSMMWIVATLSYDFEFAHTLSSRDHLMTLIHSALLCRGEADRGGCVARRSLQIIVSNVVEDRNSYEEKLTNEIIQQLKVKKFWFFFVLLLIYFDQDKKDGVPLKTFIQSLSAFLLRSGIVFVNVIRQMCFFKPPQNGMSIFYGDFFF